MAVHKHPTKERHRLLSHLDRAPAQLPWPSSNRMLVGLVSEGLAEITHRWREECSTRCYDIARVEITEKGRTSLAALAKAIRV